jgi:calcineurin-like phosphoesterase family protein
MGRNYKSLDILRQMNGTKVLIKGNHDLAPIGAYIEHFKDVRACCQVDRYILSHIPIHPESISRWRGNIHGHLHANEIGDPRYFNVSMERLNNYTPISLHEINAQYDSSTIQ